MGISLLHYLTLTRESTQVARIKFEAHNGAFPVLLSKVEVSRDESGQPSVSFWTGPGTAESALQPAMHVSEDGFACLALHPSESSLTGSLLVRGGIGEFGHGMTLHIH